MPHRPTASLEIAWKRTLQREEEEEEEDEEGGPVRAHSEIARALPFTQPSPALLLSLLTLSLNPNWRPLFYGTEYKFNLSHHSATQS